MKYLKLAMVMAVGAVVGFSTYSGNALLAVIAVILGILILKSFKGKEIVEDERTYLISEKAARMTLQIFGITTATLGAYLIAIRNELGYILEYLVCALLLLYLTFYAYYNKKYGG